MEPDPIATEICNQFISSGEKDRIHEILITRLRESGWTDIVKQMARDEIRKGPEMSVEELYEKVKPQAQQLVPDEVKNQLYNIIGDFVDKELEQRRDRIREMVLSRRDFTLDAAAAPTQAQFNPEPSDAERERIVNLNPGSAPNPSTEPFH